MKYFEVDFRIQSPRELLQDACDILSAMAGEAGFETFEETADGLKGYVQQPLFDEDALKTILIHFPIEGVKLSYEVREADNKDWNEQWEQEGFEPIVIDHLCVIHDGRHLPPSEQHFDIAIEIDARLAFGTGTHETTRMMVGTLLEMDLQEKEVLDCGCGTGILGIAALKCGARRCVGYDIDEWSADNARHNAVINSVDSGYESLLGDAGILQTVEGRFDVVMANINRNILLSDMPAFLSKMKEDGHLLLSGFYLQDIPLLAEKASDYGMQLIGQRHEGEWACLHFLRTKGCES